MNENRLRANQRRSTLTTMSGAHHIVLLLESGPSLPKFAHAPQVPALVNKVPPLNFILRVNVEPCNPEVVINTWQNDLLISLPLYEYSCVRGLPLSPRG